MTLAQILTSLIVLSILVLIHELGHFLTAKKFGIKVEEFGLGLPPKAKTLFRKNGTEYTLNWLPLGGFVRLLGEERVKILNPLKRKTAFFAKPIWQRAIVLSAGVVFNLLLGAMLFGVVYSVLGVPETVGERVVVASVVEGSPAEVAGIEGGDVFFTLAGEEIENVDEFISGVSGREGEMVSFRVGELNSDGSIADESRLIEMIPRTDPPEGEGALGVSILGIDQIEYRKEPWYKAPFVGAWIGMKEAMMFGWLMVQAIGSMLAGLVVGNVPADLGGPVEVVRVLGKASEQGVLVLIRFAGLLSINLAAFNLLPIPALDGGRLLFLVFEKIFGVKRIEKMEKWAHMAGFVLLIGLLMLVTVRDVMRLSR